MSGLPAGTVQRQNTYVALPESILVRDGFNPRLDFGNIEELAASIEASGVKVPLRVLRDKSGQKFELIDGHRRNAAVQFLVKAGRWTHPGVPIVIAERGISDAEQILEVMITNSGKPLLPLEEAAALKRLIDLGMSIAEIAKKVGHSDVYVRDHLALLDAAPEVKDALAAGKLDKTTAQQITNSTKKDKVNGNKRAAELVAKATAGKAEKRKVKEEVDPEKRKKRLTASVVRKLHVETQEALRERLAADEVTRKGLKDAVGNHDYELIVQIGYEKALADLVKMID